MSVTYKDPMLRRECGIFKILPCECDSCQSGDTHLVNLQSSVSPGGYALTYLEIASVIQLVLGRSITLKHKPISINRDAEPTTLWTAYDFEKGNSC